MVPLPRGMNKSHDVRNNLHCFYWVTSILKGIALCSHQIGHLTLYIELPSLPTMLPPTSTSMDFTDLFTVIAFHNALLQTKELTLQQRKCGNGSMPVELTGPLFGIMWPCEDSFTFPTRWQHLVGLEKCTP